MHSNATVEPIKLDLNRSIDSLFESFSSGEITNIMERNDQNSSKSVTRVYNR